MQAVKQAGVRPETMAGHLAGGRLAVARGAWVLAVAALVITFLMAVPVAYRSFRIPCSAEELVAETCSTDRLSPEGLRALAAAGLSPDFYTLYNAVLAVALFAVHLGIALVIFWRRSDEPVGMFVSFVLVLLGIFINTYIDSLDALGFGWELWVDAWQSVFWLAFATLFYVFPDGRFVPRWTVWLVPVWVYVQLAYFAALIYNPLVVLNPGNWPAPVQLILYGALLMSCLFAQIYRYRRVSQAVERQQTKWVVFGLILLVVVLLTVSVVGEVLYPALFVSGTLTDIVLDFVAFVMVLLLPITFGIAILRYRLWDIDLLIRRTLAYAVLTAGLALLYLGLVVLLQALVGWVTGEQRSALVTVLSTLAIAALFTPLRRWVQAFIDRRFYRRKYDAARTLADFGAALRDEVDLATLEARLVGVVEETMQPGQVGLWRREA
jgi:hypothetical protein